MADQLKQNLLYRTTKYFGIDMYDSTWLCSGVRHFFTIQRKSKGNLIEGSH